MKYDMGKNFIFNQVKGQVMKMTGGLYPAPLKIIEVIALGSDLAKLVISVWIH